MQNGLVGLKNSVRLRSILWRVEDAVVKKNVRLHVRRPLIRPLILLVEDEEVFQMLTISSLQKDGYHFITANSGQEALSAFKVHRPDLAILDANMPGMDGFQTCTEMRKLAKRRDLPIIMITALADNASIEKAFSAGVNEYVTKPIHWAVLRHRIRHMLERKAMEKSLRESKKNMEKKVLDRTRELRENIESRKLSESLLKQSEAKFRSLVENSPDTIMILDKKGHIVFKNRPLCHPKRGKDVPGSCFDLLPQPSIPRYKQALDRAFAQGKGDSFVIEGLASTWWQTRIIALSSPIHRRAESVTESVMVIATDITEKQVLQTKAMQNARLATVGTMAAGVAHEVNNPNNAILLQAEWLQDAWLGFAECLEEQADAHLDRIIGGHSFTEAMTKFQKFLADIVRNTRRIGLIAGNLKRMSRPNDGKLNETIRVDAILRAAQSILANQIQKHTESCIFRIDDNIPTTQGNAQQLEQLFINLILNALQALSHRKKTVRVHASYDAEEHRIVVEIRDKGVGIPEENLGKVKNPFFTTKLEQGGTGLGLSISHSIITNHKGCMEIASKPGEGTTVRVNLPLVSSVG